MDCITPCKQLLVLLYATFLFSIYQMHRTTVVEARHRPTKDIGLNDMYDCVDFYKQPAFHHPLLANHSFRPEMRPAYTPVMSRRSGAEDLSVNDVEVELKGVGCPVGTVPIRRVSEKDRIRERLHSEKYQSKYTTLNDEHPGTHYANVRTKWDPTIKYYGAIGGLSLWSPSVERSDQYSSGQIVLRNGAENIQVGWTVNPNLYGDNRTRLFIYTGAGPKTQCFNTYCPGFVHVNKDVPVDEVALVSTRGGEIYFISLVISKEPADGNWWLRMGAHLTPIGFWPNNIFSSPGGLSEAATSVEWGGQVSGPTYEPSAPMGGGEDLMEDPRYDAYCKFVSIINEAHEIVEAVDVETYADIHRYKVIDLGNRGGGFGHLVVYGGHGGALGI